MKRLLNTLVYLVVGAWLYTVTLNSGHSGFEAGCAAICGSFLLIEITREVFKDIIKVIL